MPASVRDPADTDGMVRLATANDFGGDALWDGWSRFIPRLSWRDRWLLSELSDEESSALAKALAQAAGDSQLVFDAHAEPSRRVVLEPEAWHNQRPPEERSRGFVGLGRASLRGRLDPATLRFEPVTDLVRYVTAFVDTQETRRADALVLPSHLAGGHGGPDRDGELRLAETGVELVTKTGMHKRGETQKPLFVGITIEASSFGGVGAAEALAKSYAGIGGSAYWVQFAGLSEQMPPHRVGLCAAFLYALQDLSGRRVVAVDCKNLTWPLLAGGLWGACIGIGERESWAGPHAASNERRKLKPTVTHRELLRNFRVSAEQTTRIFRELPCTCGAHPTGLVPTTRTEIRRHAFRVRLAMAEEATGANAAVGVQEWVRAAGWAADDLGLDQPPVAAYSAVFEAASDWRAFGEQ
jgi:hypothetical protein